MAVLPQELITQRTHTADVSIVFGQQVDAPGEKLWLSTRSAWDTVTNTKSVISNQLVRQVMEDRIQAAGDAAYPGINLNTKYGYGDTFVP